MSSVSGADTRGHSPPGTARAPRVMREKPVAAAHRRNAVAAAAPPPRRWAGANSAQYVARVVCPDGNENLSTLTVASISAVRGGGKGGNKRVPPESCLRARRTAVVRRAGPADERLNEADHGQVGQQAEKQVRPRERRPPPEHDQRHRKPRQPVARPLEALGDKGGALPRHVQRARNGLVGVHNVPEPGRSAGRAPR